MKLFQLKVRKNHQRVNPREWAQIRWINFLKTTMIRSICDMNVCSSFHPYVVVIIHLACGSQRQNFQKKANYCVKKILFVFLYPVINITHIILFLIWIIFLYLTDIDNSIV